MKYVRITRRMFALLGIRLREGALMVLLVASYAAFEGFGIGLLLPVLEYLESGGETLPSGNVWPYLKDLSTLVGVPLNLVTLLLLALLPILARQGVFYLQNWYGAALQFEGVRRLMQRAFRAVVRADLAFVDVQDQGQLMSFSTGQVMRCGGALLQYIKLLAAVFVAAVYVMLLALLSWQLMGISLVAMGLISLAVKRILTQSRQQGSAVTSTTNETYSAIRERLAALRLLKMRAQEDEETEYVGRLARRLKEAQVSIQVSRARVEVIVDPVLMLAVFVIIYVGVQAFDMTLAGLGLFLFVLLRLNAKTKEFNVGRQQLTSLMPSFDYVEGLVEEAEASRTITGGDREFEGLRDAVRLEDVTFTYRGGDVPVLKEVTLEIPRGSLTALVGRSGAGKSTLVDMIPRLRVPDSGRITFDGIPAEEFDLARLRQHVGFLTQEPILFNDTIYNNLAYGLEHEPTEGEVRRALEESYSTEFVHLLPDGLETRLGDRGVRFSGGQRQRLALARVLLQDPDILILDEPTSALDSESEQYIQKAFERIAEERTVVVIAHRLSTVEEADQIIVLSDGRVVETGTHSELLGRPDGHYRRLFDMQIHA